MDDDARARAKRSPRAAGRVVAMLSLVAALSLGCADASASGAPTRVLASASLAAAFDDLAAEYEARNLGARIEVHTAGTPRLVLQLREGAPAAILAAADRPSALAVVEAGRALGSPTLFATNQLVVLTNHDDVRELADLAREDLVVLLCGPDVPAGRYARAAIDAAGLEVRSASDEPSVRAVVAKVLLGEADAGVVYATDARAAGVAARAFPIPAAFMPPIEYPLLLLDGARDDPHARGFEAFVRSERGRAILGRFGFGAPDATEESGG